MGAGKPAKWPVQPAQGWLTGMESSSTDFPTIIPLITTVVARGLTLVPAGVANRSPCRGIRPVIRVLDVDEHRLVVRREADAGHLATVRPDEEAAQGRLVLGIDRHSACRWALASTRSVGITASSWSLV